MSDTADITFADLLAQAKPREATARILLDQALLDEHAELERRLASFPQGGLGRTTEADVLAHELDELEKRIEAGKKPVLFRAIGYRRWINLLRDHPPTPAQREIDKDLDYNPDTFPYEAIAASAVSPTMTVEQVHDELVDRLSLAQWTLLWSACLTANVGGNQSPKSLSANLILRRNGASVVPPTNSESPEASSLVES